MLYFVMVQHENGQKEFVETIEFEHDYQIEDYIYLRNQKAELAGNSSVYYTAVSLEDEEIVANHFALNGVANFN